MPLFNTSLIKELKEKDFYNKTPKNYKNGFLFVGAEWCVHCRNASPEIKKLSQITGLNIPVFFIDGGKKENSNLLKKLKIEGFPTIFIIYNSKLYPYDGERSAEQILKEMCKISSRHICF